MIEISNIEVWGFEHAIRGMRNPLNSWDKSDSLWLKTCYKIGNNDLDLMQRLFKAGTEHRKYLRQIFVSMDIIAPLYWWKEFDTYKVGTVANSCSTMHKIAAKEFTIDDFSHEHLTQGGKDFLLEIIDALNEARSIYINYDEYAKSGAADEAIMSKKDVWWQMIQLLPSSYNQRRTVTMNYENVFTIIKQRTGHKLDEWNEFVEALKTLPYVSEIDKGGIKVDVAEKAVSWMEKTAKDSAHGYDQQYRWGEKGDYDCSSAVITAYQKAGVPVKDKGATYTGNIKHVFLKCGFKDVTSKVNLASGAGLKRGDVLLNEVHHVAMYCGNGYEVEASVNENGHATGGKPGDQTGREFLIRPYRNFPWDCVLRYEGEKQSDGKNITDVANEVLAGKWGNGDERIKKLTAAGYDAGKVQEEVNRILGYGKKLYVDGYVGPETVKALQKWLGTEQDGIISSQPEYTMEYHEAVLSNAIEYVRTNIKGSDVVRALQMKLNIGVTGIFGKNTVQALQNMLGVDADGYLGEKTAKALQEYLNRL